MATYAVGDVQGCYDELSELLEHVRFDPARDRLWLVGDLVNRGPKSLAVLRFVRSLGDAALCVLGNHDLHLLAIRYGGHPVRRSDTFADVLAAEDCDELCDWLRHLPMLVRDDALGYVMTHAGIPHIWDLDQAEGYARELEAVLRSDGHPVYFTGLYGNRPDIWEDSLQGLDRWRAVTNYLTRMRLVSEEGRLEFAHKGAVADAPPGWFPWYELRARRPLGVRIVFGHWAAIEGVTNQPDVIALDTGCVWGRRLTALCLETGELFSIPARSEIF